MIDEVRHLSDKIIRIKARFALLYVLGEKAAFTAPVKTEETYKPAATLLGLSRYEQAISIREKNGTGDDRLWWPNQVQWARQKLKDVNALTSSRHGFWQLSEKGRNQYELLKSKLEESGFSFEKFVENKVSEIRNHRLK
jgi:hypothetical protein